jgi:hypothetical protein
MNTLVAASEYRLLEPRDSESVSPELVLVDPVLAASARQRLPVATDSLALTTLASTQPSTPPTWEPVVALATAALDAADEPVSSSSRFRSRSWAVVAGVAAATVIGLLLPDVRVVQVGRDPVSAETTTIVKPPAGQSRSGQRAQQGGTQPPPSSNRRPGDRQAPQPRRFAWAPAAGASGYHIELFRGSSKVFSTDTSEPQVTIPARWKYSGQQRSLVSGEYRWYVWPVVSGQRASQAIVQAKLVVPAGTSRSSSP